MLRLGARGSTVGEMSRRAKLSPMTLTPAYSACATGRLVGAMNDTTGAESGFVDAEGGLMGSRARREQLWDAGRLSDW